MIIVTGEDIPRYLKHLRTIRPESEASPSLRKVYRELRRGPYMCGYARIAIEPKIGFAIYNHRTSTCFTLMAFVVENSRRQGVGKRLVEEALRGLWEGGGREVPTITVCRSNPISDRFWSSMEVATLLPLRCGRAVHEQATRAQR